MLSRTIDLAEGSARRWLRRALVACVAADLLCCSLGLGAFRPQDLPGTRLAGSCSVAGIRAAFRAGRLDFPGSLAPLKPDAAFGAFIRSLYRQTWVVYAKPPFGSPAHVLQYLARYTHRVAISNHRLVSFDGESVTFRWKDYAQGNKARLMTVSAEEFLRRFLLHTLPRGFVRIRSFGFLAGPRRAVLRP